MPSKLEVGTIEQVATSLTEYLGSESMNLILEVVTSSDIQGDKLDQLEKPRSAQLIRRISAIYGSELQRANQMATLLPENWLVANREIARDVTTGSYQVRLRIEKVSGEEVLIEGPAESILQLTEFLIITLQMIDVPDAYDPASLDRFLTNVDDLVAMLRSSEPAAEESVAPAVAGEG
ncbi:MAG TPA: hypothetical protein VFR32_07910 [Gaiellaceae bacterium]|nr:hypothetical protein [Gaiellaceae bacterium]